MWVEVPKGKNAKPVNKDRFIPCVDRGGSGKADQAGRCFCEETL